MASVASLLACTLALVFFRNDPEADAWRTQHRLVDVHLHVEPTEERYARATKILDEAGIGFGLNLSGGTVTRTSEASQRDGKSEFERHKELVDRLHPGRYGLAMNFDWSDYDAPDFAQRAAQQIDDGVKQGALALKEFKRLGLYLKDGAGKRIPVDTEKLDLAWERCGALGIPVFIHVADPKAFWAPFDEKNERWKELGSHKDWWFGDPAKYPPREQLFEELMHVVGRHPKTTFVAVHFCDDPEELEKVDGWLDAHPNLCVDVAARIPEIGRSDALLVRKLFLKHASRILLGSDFMVYGKLILGSGGDDENPSDADAAQFFAKHWTFFETLERRFKHMTPIQGDWTIDAIGLPAPALRQIYFDNARRLLARGWPAPELHAKRAAGHVALNGMLKDPAWAAAPAQLMDLESDDAVAQPRLTTRCVALWDDEFLMVGFACPFTEVMTLAGGDPSKERLGLWEGDVVEAFVGRAADPPGRYAEFELAPNGERLDVLVDLPKKEFAWSSGWKSAVYVDRAAHLWSAEMMIPWAALGGAPKAGERWRLNLFRNDVANKAQLALRPTLTKTFHQPDRFATLVFDGE
jgi:hypothetical protein